MENEKTSDKRTIDGICGELKAANKWNTKMNRALGSAQTEVAYAKNSNAQLEE